MPPIRRRDRERGAIALMAVFFVLAMGALMALAMNVGQIMAAKADLQTAADAAALAAVAKLDGTEMGKVAARRSAHQVSRMNRVLAAPVEIDPSLTDASRDVLLGRWDFDAPAGTADRFSVRTNPAEINAVRVQNGATGGSGRNSRLGIFFGSFLGGPGGASVPAQATAAVQGIGRTGCVIPLTIAECKLPVSPDGTCEAGVTRQLTFANANNDAVGFANLTASNNAPNGTWVANQITNGTYCADDGFVVGQDAKLQDGNDVNKVVEALTAPGACLLDQDVTFAVTNAGCEGTPPNPFFHGTHPVVGFVRVRIVAATNQQGAPATCAEAPGGGPPAPPQGPPGQGGDPGGGGPKGNQGGGPNGNGPGGGNASAGGAKASLTIEVLCHSEPADGETSGGPAFNIRKLRLVE